MSEEGQDEMIEIQDKTLSELQEWVDQAWDRTPKDEVTETDELLFLIEELGEMAEDWRKLRGNKERSEDFSLEEEFGDILLSVITLANRCEVDLESAFEKTKEATEERYIE